MNILIYSIYRYMHICKYVNTNYHIETLENGSKSLPCRDSCFPPAPNLGPSTNGGSKFRPKSLEMNWLKSDLQDVFLAYFV